MEMYKRDFSVAQGGERRGEPGDEANVMVCLKEERGRES